MPNQREKELGVGPGLSAEMLVLLSGPPAIRGEAGAGLGLAVAGAIAEAHGTRLHAENPAEGGARFTVGLAPALD